MSRLVLLLLALVAATPAYAHPSITHVFGFGHGFAHPISGVDHVLAMVAVGLFAARLGGRALWAVPLSFVSVMALGGVIGAGGIHLPFVEIVIALSVVVLGATVAARASLPILVAMTLVGVFALFHGHAHGTEIPETVSGLTYGLGFIAATACLHAAGVGFGLMIGKSENALGQRVLRATGSAMALAGAAMLAGYL